MNDNISSSKRIQLAMFAKYWEAGKVKTRLARSIGESAARDIHLLFVQFLLRKFSDFGDFRTLVASPIEKESEFEQVLPETWGLSFQCDGDLGSRMSHFFRSSQAADQLNLLIGSDTPDVPHGYLEQCVEMLDQYQLVIGPSADGGYYLIAMQQHLADVFENVEWSSSQVLSQTLAIAKQKSISFGLLPELNDVDEIQDLRQLIVELEEQDDSSIDRVLLDDLHALGLNVG